MTRIDQFASAFLSASKTVFNHEPVPLSTALVITDLSQYEARLFGDRVRAFLGVLGDNVQWLDVDGEACGSVGDLLNLVEQQRPDLICTYRHLHSGAWKWPYGLGEHLDVLTQVTTTPVLVLPRPEDAEAFESVGDTNAVMAMTSHLMGDHRLINYAARFTEPGGTLYAAHVEDSATFERYMEVIAKIPMIETDTAREEIEKQLLKEAHDYIGSCREELARASVELNLEEIVLLGHHLAEYEKLVQDREVDLLIFNTKDDDQLAMHGLAYPLAVELRALPLLML